MAARGDPQSDEGTLGADTGKEEATYVHPGVLQDLHGREPRLHVHQQHHGDELLQEGRGVRLAFHVKIWAFSNTDVLFYLEKL